MKKSEAQQLVDMLVSFPKFDNVFNPLVDYDREHDANPHAPQIRREQFENYIETRLGKATTILIAEGESYKGAKFTGIAMTDERVLLGNKKTAPFKRGQIIDFQAQRTSKNLDKKTASGMNELTCSVLYNFLYRNDIDTRSVVTWNAFPFHPHKPNAPLTNRAPKAEEIEAAHHIHREFFNLFPECNVISIGNYATELMEEMGIPADSVRHPAFGGATIFTNFMKARLKSEPRQERFDMTASLF